jgi:hypothetical protein
MKEMISPSPRGKDGMGVIMTIYALKLILLKLEI